MSISLTNLFNLIKITSGQFIIDDLDETKLDIEKFWALTKPAVDIYDKYLPTKTVLNLTLQPTYTFPKDNAPEWISSVYPSGAFMAMSLYVYQSSNPNPFPVFFRYEKPTLYVNIGCEAQVTAHYKRKCKEIRDENNKLTNVIIEDLDFSDNYFTDLVTGYFLISLGKSRRSFTLSDFPAQMDSSDLVSEGQTLIDNSMQAIRENSYFQYSLGG